jgi:hypothetical protein
MKRFYFALLLSLFAPAVYSQNNYTEIYGAIEGPHYGKIFLFFDGEYDRKDSLSADITDGKFYFKVEGPRPVLGRLHLGQTSTVCDVYIEGPQMEITCVNNIKDLKDTLNELSITRVTGSHTEEVKRQFESWLEKLTSSGLPDKEISDKYFQQLYTLIQTNPGSKIGPYLLSKAHNLIPSQIDSLNRMVSPALANTFEEKEALKLIRQ